MKGRGTEHCPECWPRCVLARGNQAGLDEWEDLLEAGAWGLCSPGEAFVQTVSPGRSLFHIHKALPGGSPVMGWSEQACGLHPETWVTSDKRPGPPGASKAMR